MQRWILNVMMAGGAAALLIPTAGCPIFANEEYRRSFPVAENLNADVLARSVTPIGGLALAADGRIFYTEKNTGAIRVVKDGQLLTEPVATVPVNFAGERGLLGIAVHPAFANNGRLYVFYSRADIGANTSDPVAIVDHRIVYFTVAGDVATSGEIFVASLPAGGTLQVGGGITFDPGGRLLVGVGDLEDPPGAQDPGRLNGKILRFNDDGSIPGDNPTAGSAVFGSGVRDPRGFAADRSTGNIYFVDRSPGNRGEVNRLEPGANYGWDFVEGQVGDAAFRDPLLDSGNAASRWTGIGLNLSTLYGPSLRNTLFIGEAATRQMQLATLGADQSAVINAQVIATGLIGDPVDIAVSPSGTVYVACTNSILRLAPYR